MYLSLDIYEKFTLAQFSSFAPSTSIIIIEQLPFPRHQKTYFPLVVSPFQFYSINILIIKNIYSSLCEDICPNTSINKNLQETFFICFLA